LLSQSALESIGSVGEVSFTGRTADSLKWFEVPILVRQLQGLVRMVRRVLCHHATQRDDDGAGAAV
jgi:hypothetical protein